jgi:hypothetical protein
LFSQCKCSVSPIHAFFCECVSSNNVVCSLLCFTSAQTATMSMLWKGANLVVPISFPIVGIYSFFLTIQAIGDLLLNLVNFFAGCSTQYYCGDCRTQLYCGWCLEESNCSTSAHCWARQRTWVASDCPCKKKEITLEPLRI